MPDNSSGFVDFNTYSDLNRDDETRLMEEAMQRAEAADREAGVAMAKSKQQARGNMDWREGSSTYGQQVGAVEDIAQTASYSDYLAAKKTAESAWAQLAGGTGRAGALRGAIRGGSDMDERAKAGIDASKARGAEGIDWARQNAGGAGQRNAATLAERKRREDEVAGRAAADREAKKTYLTGIYDRFRDWRNNDPSEQQRYAQQLSTGVDDGFAIPDGPGKAYQGAIIERNAWSDPFKWQGSKDEVVNVKTKKGTAY